MADEYDVEDVDDWAKRQLDSADKGGEGDKEEGEEEAGHEALVARLRDVATKMQEAQVERSMVDEVLSIANDLETEEEDEGEGEEEEPEEEEEEEETGE